MRVVHVCADPGVPVFGSKGASVHVQAVIRELLRRGAQVHLVAARVGGEQPRDLDGLVLHELPRITGEPGAEREASARSSARAAAAVLDRLHDEAPLDLVYERYSLWSATSMAWARAHSVPGVLEVNAPLVDEQAQHRVLVDRAGAEQVAADLLAAAASVIAVSEPVARWVAERTSNPAVHVVANGVDTRSIRPRECDDDGAGPFVIGFVGTLKPWHGVEVLLDAFATLARTDDRTRLRIVGDGPQRDALATQAVALGVSHRVDLVGAVAPADMPDQLARMDVAVAPYPRLPDFYFSPLKIYEYLAAGVPVVASDIGPCAQILDGGDLGMLVPPGDPTALAATLAGLRSDARLRAELASAGRRAAETRHDWSLVVSQVLATLPVPTDGLLGRTA